MREASEATASLSDWVRGAHLRVGLHLLLVDEAAEVDDLRGLHEPRALVGVVGLEEVLLVGELGQEQRQEVAIEELLLADVGVPLVVGGLGLVHVLAWLVRGRVSEADVFGCFSFEDVSVLFGHYDVVRAADGAVVQQQVFEERVDFSFEAGEGCAAVELETEVDAFDVDEDPLERQTDAFDQRRDDVEERD